MLRFHYMVAEPGIAPGTRAYETREILLLHSASMVPYDRIELPSEDYKTTVMPLY